MRTEEQFSAEESAALEAMKSDVGADLPEPQPEPVQEAEPQQEPVKAEAEEPKPEFKSARTPEKPPEGFVPHQAMHAERMKRQELERKVAELEAKLQPPAEQPPQWVDPLIDPEGFKRYDDWRQKDASEKLERIQREIQMERATKARAQAAAELEAEFARDNSDYPEAVAFLHNARVSELREAGMDDAQIRKQLAQDANTIFDGARAIGLNPAEVLYMRAKRAGFAAPQIAPQEAQQEADKIVALDRAQKQTQGLGAASGPQSGKLTARDLASMTEAELAKVPADEIRRIMGG